MNTSFGLLIVGAILVYVAWTQNVSAILSIVSGKRGGGALLPPPDSTTRGIPVIAPRQPLRFG